MQIETWRLRYAEARVLFSLARRGGEWREPEKADRYLDGHEAAAMLDVLAADDSIDHAIACMAFVLAVALRAAL